VLLDRSVRHDLSKTREAERHRDGLPAGVPGPGRRGAAPGPVLIPARFVARATPGAAARIAAMSRSCTVTWVQPLSM